VSPEEKSGRVSPGVWTVCRSEHDGVCAPTGVWRPDPKKRHPDHVSILHGGVCAPGDVCRLEKEAASEHGETASFIAVGGARLQQQCGSAAWRKRS
jgi:hypothetical protein